MDLLRGIVAWFSVAPFATEGPTRSHGWDGDTTPDFLWQWRASLP